ncbi:hypothetical protein D3C72_1494320 [compost metagenome]
MSIGWRHDARVIEVDLRRLDGRLRIGHGRFQRLLVDHHAMHALLGDVEIGARLRQRRRHLRLRGARLVVFALRQRAIGHQLLHAIEVGAGLARLRFRIRHHGLADGNARLRAGLLLRPVRQRRLLRGQLGLGLLVALLVDAVVDAHQQLAFLDVHEILHRHLHHIARQLRANDGHLPPHGGVFRRHDGTRERRQTPRIQHDQHAHQGHGGKGQRGQPLVAAVRLRRGSGWRRRGRGCGRCRCWWRSIIFCHCSVPNW